MGLILLAHWMDSRSAIQTHLCVFHEWSDCRTGWRHPSNMLSFLFRRVCGNRIIQQHPCLSRGCHAGFGFHGHNLVLAHPLLATQHFWTQLNWQMAKVIHSDSWNLKSWSCLVVIIQLSGTQLGPAWPSSRIWLQILGDESYRRSPNGSNERNTFCSTLLGVNREDDAWETQKCIKLLLE